MSEGSNNNCADREAAAVKQEVMFPLCSRRQSLFTDRIRLLPWVSDTIMKGSLPVPSPCSVCFVSKSHWWEVSLMRSLSRGEVLQEENTSERRGGDSLLCWSKDSVSYSSLKGFQYHGWIFSWFWRREKVCEILEQVLSSSETETSERYRRTFICL